MNGSTGPGRPLDASGAQAPGGAAAEGGLREAAARKGSLWQTMQAVAWSFFGVRRSADHARDVSQLNPVHVVIAGVLGAALFVAGLWMFVNWMVGSGAAR